MAPVLLCPECGTKHPLDRVADRSAFPCAGCGRTLKVPTAAQPSNGTSGLPPVPPPPVDALDELPWPTASKPSGDPDATQVFGAPLPPGPELAAPLAVAPPVPPPGAPSPLDGARPAAAEPTLVPPRGVRFALWFAAVPLAFLVVFTFARAVGLLTTNEVTDVALANGWSRFWPIARLLPFVALVTAGLLQGAVFGITRWRTSRRHPPASPARADARPTALPSTRTARPAARPRARQSARKGA